MTVQLERLLQRECMLRLKPLPVIAIPVPNSMFIPTRTVAEKELVKRVVYQMKNSGMLVPGSCDIALLWAGGSAAIELKRPKTKDLTGATRPAGRPSDKQVEFARRCAELGIRHAYITSWEELKERLWAWGVIDGHTQRVA